MNWERPASLGKTVEATATNRPIKIAYLVPFDDATSTHLILDAVFFESYTRWAGMYTLVLPTTSQGFMAAEYEEWLQRYDPDFVYSYVDLDAAFVDTIDRLCCPIAMLKHEKREAKDQVPDWRSFLPRWDHYFHPVSSISTLLSPASYAHYRHEERPREPTVLTQFSMQPSDRFLADNFGTGFSLTNVTHAISGFFRTLCLVPPNLPDTMVAGSERCLSALEAFRAVTDCKATPIARLAMVHSAGVPRPESLRWTSAFRLFVGSTTLDRLHFWNCRHLGSNWSETPNAMIVESSFFEDDQLVKQLGQYLNKHNFLGRSGGHYEVEIHSHSLAQADLLTFRDKLTPQTWNGVRVSEQFNAIAVPSYDDLAQRLHDRAADKTTLKLTEDSSDIVAAVPAHFAFLPPQLRGHARGQWIVELDIQRHNNLTRYSNVIYSWTLPRRLKVVRAFTNRLAKPTGRGLLALVPASSDFPFGNRDISNPSRYEVFLPSDTTFFRHLALNFFQHPADDLRAIVPRAGYVDLAVSDKGRNLRGVVSLFGDLDTASGILTGRFWRDVLEKAEDDSTRPRLFNWNRLFGLFPNDKATIQRLTKELHFDRSKDTWNYLRAGLRDTLENLVRANVFYLVAPWPCAYCGHANSRSFDNMRLKNQCDICGTEFLPRIDMEWQYELNAFVHRSLQRHDGLPVLWALGKLQHSVHTGSFWYLPEVDLFDKDDDPMSKNEMDILCMRNGAFCVAEVKRSATTFLNDSAAPDKFLRVVELLRPDVAQLAFERYCAEGVDQAETKARLERMAKEIRERIGRWTKLEIVVAQDLASFREYSGDFGWSGPRIREIALRG